MMFFIHPRRSLRLGYDEAQSYSLQFSHGNRFHWPQQPLRFSHNEKQVDNSRFSWGNVFNSAMTTSLIQP